MDAVGNLRRFLGERAFDYFDGIVYASFRAFAYGVSSRGEFWREPALGHLCLLDEYPTQSRRDDSDLSKQLPRHVDGLYDGRHLRLRGCRGSAGGILGWT